MKRIRGSSLMSIRVRPMFAALLSTLFVCFAAFGQTVNYTTGSIAGKVSDDAGAGVPGVQDRRADPHRLRAPAARARLNRS